MVNRNRTTVCTPERTAGPTSTAAAAPLPSVPSNRTPSPGEADGGETPAVVAGDAADEAPEVGD